MAHKINEAAAAAIVEGERAVANLATLHDRLRPHLARAQPYAQARKYLTGLMSDLPRTNGWTIAEHTGDLSPDPTQRLLNHAVWDHDQAVGVIRGFVAEHLREQPLVVAALDESGQEQAGHGHGRGHTPVPGLRGPGRHRGEHRVLGQQAATT